MGFFYSLIESIYACSLERLNGNIEKATRYCKKAKSIYTKKGNQYCLFHISVEEMLLAFVNNKDFSGFERIEIKYSFEKRYIKKISKKLKENNTVIHVLNFP